MKLGSDFWFWFNVLFEIIKAILAGKPKDNPNPTTPGERMFKAVMGNIVDENEDDKHTAAEVSKL